MALPRSARREGGPQRQARGLISILDVQNWELGELLSHPTDELWPLQPRHPSVGDQEIKGSESEAKSYAARPS
jgi:hypothetical protein